MRERLAQRFNGVRAEQGRRHLATQQVFADGGAKA